MDKLYKKNELGFSLFLIIDYIVFYSAAEVLSKRIGVEKSLTFAFTFIFTVSLLYWINKNGLKEKYGLTSPQIPAKRLLYYIPLVLIASVNLWFGVRLNYSILETVLYVLTMFCVGFLEEIIARGFIFKALEKDNTKRAIIISSVAFGVAHIFNLFNGSGMELLANFLQVFYAIAVGFLFVTLFYKTKSLLPSIICHGVLNALSAFANVEAATTEVQIFSALALIVLSAGYSFYIYRVVK